MAWIYLFIASIFEISFAIAMKYTEGFTRLIPSVLTIAMAISSVLILSQALTKSAARNGLCDLDGQRRSRHNCNWNVFV